ncbi:MAG TPA: phosphatidylcholine/phosphatidylserine synthase [Candidatus Acidoferrales bacterium]|jgi:CDP-diacylglycerol--serine O-phosphatidyltransferase|nr:phosphatidylcholine/phosphatidylserine synthase [Candidatus Acidoferrales bacterium]
MEFNDLDPIGHEEFSQSRFRKQRHRRGIHILPGILTVVNLLCGYYAVLATLEGAPVDLDNAARAIGIAILADSLDGRVARAMGTDSEFGKQFDSLADVVSFGLAPAFLAYVWGVRSLAAAEAPPELHLVQLGWFVGFFFLACCAWRLARFNIQGMAPGSSRFFVGMPCPAAAGMIAAVVHFAVYPISDVKLSILWLAMVVALGALMSSTFRYYSFKDIQWTKRQPSLAVILIALLIGAMVLVSRPTLLAIAGAYTLHGVVLQVVRTVRHRLASRPA